MPTLVPTIDSYSCYFLVRIEPNELMCDAKAYPSCTHIGVLKPCGVTVDNTSHVRIKTPWTPVGYKPRGFVKAAARALDAALAELLGDCDLSNPAQLADRVQRRAACASTFARLALEQGKPAWFVCELQRNASNWYAYAQNAQRVADAARRKGKV